MALSSLSDERFIAIGGATADVAPDVSATDVASDVAVATAAESAAAASSFVLVKDDEAKSSLKRFVGDGTRRELLLLQRRTSSMSPMRASVERMLGSIRSRSISTETVACRQFAGSCDGGESIDEF